MALLGDVVRRAGRALKGLVDGPEPAEEAPAPDKAGADEPADEAPAGAASPAAERAARFRRAIEDIRKSANTSAKALAALGTTGLSLLAIQKFSDIFPIRRGETEWAVAAIVGFFAVAVGLALFTGRLWKVDSPVFLSDDEDQVAAELTADELEAAKVRERYAEMARLNGASSLAAYALRGRRLERLAAELDAGDPRRAQLLATARLVSDDVAATMAVVGADVVRRRARNVVWGPETAWIAMLFIAGLAMVAVSVDHLDSERTGRLAVAKECAAVGKALQDQVVAPRGVPPMCAEVLDVPVAAGDDERTLARANACASAVKALADQQLDASALTGAGGPCPKAQAPAAQTRAQVVDGFLAALLARAQACEEAAAGDGADPCAPIYDAVERERARRRGPGG